MLCLTGNVSSTPARVGWVHAPRATTLRFRREVLGFGSLGFGLSGDQGLGFGVSGLGEVLGFGLFGDQQANTKMASLNKMPSVQNMESACWNGWATLRLP